MGEFADMCIERDWNDHIDSIDRYYKEDDIDDSPFDCSFVDSGKLYGKNKLPYKDFNNGDSVLLRQEGNKLNRVCTIIKKTSKAVLFKIDCKEEDDLENDCLFWMPKSVIFMLEGELKVYYLKPWATIKDIITNRVIPTNNIIFSS